MALNQKLERDKILTATYLELHRFGQNGDYDKALKAANRILHMAPQEEKAFHCKVVCLIQQSKFYEALQTMNKNAILSTQLYFEKAYCQYRQNQTTKALETIGQVEVLDYRLKELKAQILYRLEQFKEAHEIYCDIIKNSQDDYVDERETNLGAVLVQLNDKSQTNVKHFRNDTYELCYNWACLMIARNEYNEAEKKLKYCEKLCREFLEDDGVTDGEIDVELSAIRKSNIFPDDVNCWLRPRSKQTSIEVLEYAFRTRIQLAYVYQKQGRLKEAQHLYTSALKLKLDDAALIAVASNNMVVINKDQNVFDSKKKMKAATVDSLIHKLPSRQRMFIALNNAILMYYTNQLEQCNKMCNKIEENWSTLALVARMTNALCHAKSGDLAKAMNLLNRYVPKNNTDKLAINLLKVHILLMQGEQVEACKVLENMDEDSYKPGIVGALITLYLGMKKKETALKVFEKTVAWYKKTMVKSGDLSNMWRQAAEFHMRNRQYRVAANSLEELIRINPNNKKALAKLCLAYAHFDKKKATQLLSNLPVFKERLVESELDILENSHWLTLKKTINKIENSPGTPKAEKGDKKKKNGKRKTKSKRCSCLNSTCCYCNRNTTPDPERWLPKYERTGYRKRRDRRNKDVIKGSQGTSSIQSDQYDFSKISEQEQPGSPAVSAGQPSPQPRSSQRKMQQQKKKNKRR